MSDDEGADENAPINQEEQDEKALRKQALSKRIQNLNQIRAEAKVLEREYRAHKERIKSLQEQVTLIKGGEEGLAFYIERVRGRRQSIFWVALVLVSLGCIHASIARGSYALEAVNLLAFLALFRGLYVESNQMPTFVSVLVIGYTLKWG
jgi:uncharacterized membrane protein